MKIKTESSRIKYFAYLRKSSEAEERQSLSIPAQLDRVKVLFGDLEIVDYFTESHSAFKPYNRPEFARMIERIKKGEANGIISWHPDRLSRNEIDGATVTYMLREGKIKDLKFGSYTFINAPEGIMMLQMSLSQGQYYSAKLGADVKRGMENKLKMGWMPMEAPNGYLNYHNLETGINEIKPDPDRFELIRRMWDLMLTGNYMPPLILKMANEEWGLTTIKRRKRGGGPLSRTAIYKMFNNFFYAGIIVYKGEQHQGIHKPMVTLEEFEHVQMILGKKGKPCPQKHSFPFTGLIRCGSCGARITAEYKRKVNKTMNILMHYTYYHCTHKKKDVPCHQRKGLTAENLEKQIEREINSYTILPIFRDWALEVLRERNDVEIADRSEIYKTQQRAILETQDELDKLTKMRYRDLLDDDEYLKNKNELKTKINRLKEEINDTEHRADQWLDLTETFFDFAAYALKAFSEDNLQQKKEILAALGQNFVITDQILKIEPHKWFVPIENGYPALESKYLRLEPALEGVTTGSNDTKNEALQSLRSDWRG